MQKGFPADAETNVRALNGVTAAGITWTLPGNALPTVTTSLDPRATGVPVEIMAASPGYFQAAGATLAQGVLFDAYEQNNHLPVAVLGPTAARDLGISHLIPTPVVYIHGTGYAVIGILADVTREPETLSQIIIPTTTAAHNGQLPSPQTPAHMLIATRLGAAHQIAHETPLAIRPDQPDHVTVDPINDQLAIQSHITDALQSLLWALAAITLLMGAVGIANTTYTTVIERTPEIGLRRATGATRRNILTQFLAETASLGLLGGLIGTAIATLVVLAVALANHWTALLDPATTATGPLIGMATSLIAGARPAWKAAHIQPIEALRR